MRNDLAKLQQRSLIRPGDQSLAAHIPADCRPVVYDLALERKQASGRKRTSARQSASAATSDRFTEPPPSDQQEHRGSGNVLPHGSQLPAGSEEQRERKPASYKPTDKPKEPTPAELAAAAAKSRAPSGNAGDVIAAYVEGAVAAGLQRPPEKLRARVGRDAKQLIGEGWVLDSLIESARRMGAGEFNDLAVQVRKDDAAAKGRASANGKPPTSDQRKAQAEALKDRRRQREAGPVLPHVIPGSVIE